MAMAGTPAMADLLVMRFGRERLSWGSASRLQDAGALRPEQVSVGKLNSTREAIAIARTCRTILGGSGVTLE